MVTEEALVAPFLEEAYIKDHYNEVVNDLLDMAATEKVTPLELQAPALMAAVESVISAGELAEAPNYIL